METLGDKIKLLRKKLTQEELAALLKVERSTLASWEVNRREPDISTLCRLAALFQVSVDWLVGQKIDNEAYPSRTGQFHEAAGDYQPSINRSWHKVITTAQAYGLEPSAVLQLIEVSAKIALSLKDSRLK